MSYESQLNPAELRRREQSIACMDQERDNANDLAMIAELDDESLAGLKAEVLERLKPNIRPMYAEKDPKKSKALGLAIAMHIRTARAR